MIVLRLDPQFWGDVTGFLVQAERTGVRACVANPAYTFIVTSQFICTRPEMADGRVYWLRPVAPRGSTVLARLRQAVVTAGRMIAGRGAAPRRGRSLGGGRARRPGTRHGRTARLRALRLRPWAVTAVWVLGVIAAFACYLQLARTRAVNSDGAGQALQAWDMLHGNLLLHGWSLGDVSYYTTELPQYMLVELVRGLNAGRRARGRGHDLHARDAAGRVAGQGQFHRASGPRARAHRGRHHARAAAGFRSEHPPLLTGPHRHVRAGDGGLADPGPCPPPLVCPGHRRGVPRLGDGRGHAGALHRGAAARGGMRDPRLPGRGRRAEAAGVAVV